MGLVAYTGGYSKALRQVWGYLILKKLYEAVIGSQLAYSVIGNAGFFGTQSGPE